MPVRLTSVTVYNEIKNNGLLSKIRWRVYRIIFKYGPMTANEVGVIAKQIYADKTYRHNYSARCNELREMGVIVEVGTKPCPCTGKVAIAWDVTNKLPVKPIKPVTAKEQIKLLKKKINRILEVLDSDSTSRLAEIRKIVERP